MFPCSGCGACCRRISVAVENAKLIDIGVELTFPYGWDKDGVCEKLVDNRCSIYEDRPLLCRIDDIQKISGIKKKKFYKATAKACNSLIDEFGLNKSYKVWIT